MKTVVFKDQTTHEISPVSSQYALVLNTVDQEEVSEFEALLTPENLSEFMIFDEDGNLESKNNNFVYVSTANNSFGDSDHDETTFQLAPMSAKDLRIKELEEEVETQAEAIEELASLVAG